MSLKFGVKGAFSLRYERNFLAGGAATGLNIFNESVHGKAVGDDYYILFAEVVGKGFSCDRLYSTCFKGDNRFFFMWNSLKMHGLAVAGQISSLCSRTVEQQEKNISRISHIGLMFHKEIIP